VLQATSPGASKPPPIPSARWVWEGPPVRPLLIWVRAGTVHLHLGDDGVIHLEAGEGAWLPAGGHGERSIVTDPGTVAFPLWPHASVGPGGAPGLTRFEVPAAWQDWLIQIFNLQVTPFNGRGYSPEAIADLLRHSGTQGPAPSATGPRPSTEEMAVPVMPHSPGARAVAEELVRDPALDLTVAAWAARVATSPRTLRRDFLTDTGLTFEQWRLLCRLGAAVEFLAAGYDVDQVAARVGFASRNGLTRAFKGRFGATPYEFSRELAAHPGAGGLTQRTAAARQTDDLIRMMRTSGSPAAPELMPAASTPSHTNEIHVLSWMYRGSGYLDIGDRRYERDRGVATWIPADLEHVTGLRENSVSLPLGIATTGDLQLDEPLQVRFSPAWDDYLMFCAISARSDLRPDDHNPRHVLDLFADQVAAQRALSVPMPNDPRARALALEFLRRIGDSCVTSDRDIPAEVHRAFRDETGMALSRWRYAARMRIARDLLIGGASPSAVARRTGYAHLPTFSAAFSRFHGVSPRQFQERELDRRHSGNA